MKSAARVGVDLRQFLLFEAERAGAQLAELLGWVAEGRLAPPVGRRFSLEAAPDALAYALSGAGMARRWWRLWAPPSMAGAGVSLWNRPSPTAPNSLSPAPRPPSRLKVILPGRWAKAKPK